MFQEFPYTDMHQLNLDWIIKIAKDFLDQYSHLQQLITDGETSLQNLTTEGMQQLQEKADNLETLLQQWYDSHSTDIADELADAIYDLNEWYSTHETYLDQILIDNVSSFNTQANAIKEEVIESIPADYTETSETAEEALKRLKELKLNLLIDAEWIDDKAIEVYTGRIFDTALYKMAMVNLPCNHGKLTYKTIASSPKTNICFYDANDQYIIDYWSTEQPAVYMEQTVDIPENAAKVGISCYVEFNTVYNCKLFIDVAETIDDIYSDMKTNINKFVPSREIIGQTIEIDDAIPNTELLIHQIGLSSQQAGSGTPSPDNVRNISGTTQINIYHNSDTIVESFNGHTVYNGQANLKAGVLYYDSALAEFDGSENWREYSVYNGFYLILDGMKEDADYREKGISNWLPYNGRNFDTFGICVGVMVNVIYVTQITNTIPGISSLADWKTYLANHHLQVIYPIETPVSTSIDKVNSEITSGINTFSSSTGSTYLKYLVNTYERLYPFKYKTLACIGDSIMWGFGPENTDYYRQQIDSYPKIAADYNAMTFINRAIPGCTVAYIPSIPDELYPIVNRWNDLPDSADLILVSGGTNDVRLHVPLGLMSDRVNTTWYGAWHIICEGLYKKYFTAQGMDAGKKKKIVIITPIKLIGTPAASSGENGTLFDMESYINAMIEVANYYGFPVLDLYHNAPINPEIYCTVQSTTPGYEGYYNMYTPDGVHPTKEGQYLLADVLKGFMKTLK